MVDRLFVYGTLRDGQPARAIIAGHVAGTTAATSTGRLFALPGGYPGLVEDATATVVGEVVTLTGLAAAFALLDAYEGDEFLRALRRVWLDGGEEVWAWCYVLSDADSADGCELIASGDWLAHTRAP